MRAREHAIVAAVLVLGGCSAIIGVKDLTYDESLADDGGTSSGTSGGSSGTSGGSSGTSGGSSGTSGSSGADASCTADLKTSGDHCGRCNHPCGGAACVDGKCEALELARDQDGPSGITVDATTVYFTNYGSDAIMKVPKAGGVPATVLTPFGSPTTILFEPKSGRLYFGGGSSTGSITWCDPKDCAGKLTKVSAGAYVDHFVLRDGVFYFSADGELRRVNLDGTGERALDTTAGVFDVATDGQHAYFTSLANSLKRVPLDGGTVESVGTALNPTSNENYVTVDADRYYWTSRPSGTTGVVASSPKATPGVGVTELTSSGKGPTGVAVDDTYIYWLEAGTITNAGQNNATPDNNGRLLACKKAGCGAETIELAKGCKLGGTIAMDEQFLYWHEFGGGNLVQGRIRKVAKP